MKEIKLSPFKGTNQDHNIWSYYFGLTDFERTELDTSVTMGPNNRPVFPSEKSIPIINIEDKDKAKELLVLMEKYIDLCRYAVRPIACCGKKRRTSCYCCFKQVFGSTY